MNTWINSFYEFLQQQPSLTPTHPKPSWKLPATNSIATDEAFWNEVRNDFPISEYPINLNSGAVSSSPSIVENAYLHFYQLMNTAPSYYIWKVMEAGKEIIREGLAQLINGSKDEVAILRNTTEAMNNIIFGLPLEKADEVVLCRQDYAKVVSSWRQRELRDGILLNWVDINPVTDSDDNIVQKYVAAFTEYTKVVNITHTINWNGQVLPVERIIKEAKKRGIEVILDAAHSFAKLETDMAKLQCDYCVATLHKWLSGPITSAMVYVRKEKIKKLWPLASSVNPISADIRKLEELSIQLYPNVLALGFAIEYYHRIGRKVKEERLRHLRRLWTEPLQSEQRLKWNTPLQEERCCTIVNVSVDGYDPAALEKVLLDKYNIHVGIVMLEKLNGIRVTPNIYTKPAWMEQLVSALKDVSRK